MKTLFILMATGILAFQADAQDVTSIFTAVVSKVIRAIDLQVQRKQTGVILLQNVQGELEKAMSALRLGEIQDWLAQVIQQKLSPQEQKKLSSVIHLLARITED